MIPEAIQRESIVTLKLLSREFMQRARQVEKE
jgi:hypothetical protein